MVYTDFVEIMERAARNGTKAHLPVDIVRAAIQHPAYAQYQAERIKEIAASWDEVPTPPVSSSGRTGSGIASTATTGASAGTMTEDQEALVGRAASARASEAVQMVARRNRRKTP